MRYSITIKPNSKKGPLIERGDDGLLMVYIREVAVDGKANEALIKLLAKHFRVSKSRVSIVRGHTSRHKIINID